MNSVAHTGSGSTRTARQIASSGSHAMDEIEEQLRTLLLRPTFWSDQWCAFDEVAGGTSIHILGDKGPWSWKIIWPDGTACSSDNSFDDWLDVRIDLRTFLTRRRASFLQSSNESTES
jgi:hypothetical protein